MISSPYIYEQHKFRCMQLIIIAFMLLCYYSIPAIGNHNFRRAILLQNTAA